MPGARRGGLPLPAELALSGAGPAVVLVHGLWFSRWTLRWLAGRLAAHGLRPHRFGYDTTGAGFAESARRLDAFVAALGEPRVHLVGHSLGGLLIRALLHHYPVQPPGRVVTLGSPHGGSRSARVAARWPPLRWLSGRAIAALVAGEPDAWGPPPRELGVVAGTRPIGIGRLFPGLPRPHDGVVTQQEALLSGAAAALALPVTHTQMIFSPRVAREVAHFLEHGSFSPGAPGPAGGPARRDEA